MRGTWSGLGLLLVVPWLAGCVSGPQVRLDTGQGAPIVYTPPAEQPPPVRLTQEGPPDHVPGNNAPAGARPRRDPPLQSLFR